MENIICVQTTKVQYTRISCTNSENWCARSGSGVKQYTSAGFQMEKDRLEAPAAAMEYGCK